MPWLSASSINGHKPLPVSCTIRRAGMSLPLADTATAAAWPSIRSCFPAPCTAWPATCTRSSSQRRAPVLPDRVGAEAAVLAVVGAAHSSRQRFVLIVVLIAAFFAVLPPATASPNFAPYIRHEQSLQSYGLPRSRP